MRIFLAEIVAYNPAIAGEVTLHFSSGVGYNHPTAPGYFEPRLSEPGQISRTMFSARTTSGAVEVGFGELRLINNDGLLDYLIDYGFDGRKLTLYSGQDTAAFSAFETVFTGTMRPPRYSEKEVQFLVRDRLFELDKPLLTTTYAGTNVLPAGVEGTEDIKGNVKPRLYGTANEISPILVNTAGFIYQISDTPLSAVGAVYDNSLPITAEAPYTSQADMEANSPAPGFYRVWLAGGTFRLGSKPIGQVTADATQGATAADRTAAQILRALALAGGMTAGDISASDVTELDSDNSSVCGLWIAGPETTKTCMETVASSVGAWFGFDRFGKLRMTRFEAPAGPPVRTLIQVTENSATTATTLDVLSIALVSGNDEDMSIPIHRVNLDYARCYTPKRDVLEGALTIERRNFLEKEYRRVLAEDATVKIKHPLSQELTFQTQLVTVAAAQSEADRQLAMRKVRRDRVNISLKIAQDDTNALDLNTTVSVKYPRWGYNEGKLFKIVGITQRLSLGVVDLDLWG